ncbi:AAA family ATPase [Curtobacterium sp. YR515]|uniref:AAA family ATPase n=1 Tax=Curtobacterium sp. YR515 TaxID=1855316 RepID=UPI0008E24EE9|nr:AAA family ATPase [Curtobacterium sp. YR515]SFF33351.1 MoxR-like ATPase [Curtobacterium sp. YR515]
MTDAAHAAPFPSATAVLERALFEVKHVIVGQDAMVERMMIGLLARGHVLLEGVPGVAKTLAVRTLATVVGGDFVRLQFTPDLMPSDIVGTRVWRPSTETFDVERGPVFANLVLADEINRAPAKVQSALLEAMAEQQVSIGGQTHRLPDPFLVLATQNPIENDGVYQLPEAQRDRFLLKVDVDHADELEELTIVQRMSAVRPVAQQILTIDEVRRLQVEAEQVFVHHAVALYAVQLVMATRHPHRYGIHTLDGVLEYGVSARGSLGLVAAARALALLRGRDYVLPGDVADVASDVLAHRLVLTFDAVADGVDPRTAVDTVLQVVPQPRVATAGDPNAVAAGDGTQYPPAAQPPAAAAPATDRAAARSDDGGRR